VLLEGAPLELSDAARGRIWRRTVETRDVAELRQRYDVLSTRLFAGRTIVHILSDDDPGNGFTLVEPGLIDVYFATLASRRRAA
jgi:hypothetical protein